MKNASSNQLKDYTLAKILINMKKDYSSYTQVIKNKDFLISECYFFHWWFVGGMGGTCSAPKTNVFTGFTLERARFLKFWLGFIIDKQ